MGDKWIRKCYVLQEFRFRFLEVHYESGKKDSIESRQKKPAPFRFPGLRKCRESSTSAVSFFLSKSELSRGELRFGFLSFLVSVKGRGSE